MPPLNRPDDEIRREMIALANELARSTIEIVDVSKHGLLMVVDKLRSTMTYY
jgi:hypothetical protein